MTDDESWEFCRRWLAAWTGNQPDKLRAFYTDDAIYRDPARPAGLQGVELLSYFRKLLAKNPEWTWEAVEIWPTPKGFCLKWKARIPAGAKGVEETGLDIVEMRDGKISHNEVYFDRVALIESTRP